MRSIVPPNLDDIGFWLPNACLLMSDRTNRYAKSDYGGSRKPVSSGDYGELEPKLDRGGHRTTFSHRMTIALDAALLKVP